MAAKKSAYQQSTLELLLGISPSANRWIALFTVMPTATTAGTEVSDSGYARQAVTFAAVSGTPKQSSNSADLDFPLMVDAPVTIVGFAVMDAVTAGNQIYYGTLTNFTAPIGVGVHIEASQLVIIET